MLSIVISVLWQAKTRTDSKSPSCLYHLNHRHWSHSCCSCFQGHPCHQGHCRQGRRDHHRVAHRTPTLPPNQMVNPGESVSSSPIAYIIYIYIYSIERSRTLLVPLKGKSVDSLPVAWDFVPSASAVPSLHRISDTSQPISYYQLLPVKYKCLKIWQF